MFPIPFNFPFIKKNGERTTIGDAINAGGGGGSYTLPTASANTKGGVKIGSGLTMTGEVLSADLPTASAETLGGVKVGSGLSITDGVLSAVGGGGGGVQFVDLHPKASFGSGTRVDSVSISDLISESTYNENLANKTIYAVNVINNNNVRLFGISGNTYSNTVFTWFGTGSATLSTSDTLRIFYVDNPT